MIADRPNPTLRSNQAPRSNQAQKLEATTGRYDPVLATIAIAIAGIGVVMVGSSSIAVADGQGLGPFYFLIRHVVFLLGGIALASALMRTELKWLDQRSHLMLILCFLLLAAVFIPGVGRTINGAKRWINLGFSNFQTVEAVKPMLIVWLSSYLVRYREDSRVKYDLGAALGQQFLGEKCCDVARSKRWPFG